MDSLISSLMTISKFAMISLSVLMLVRCIRSMLSERYESEVWAYIRVGDDTLPVSHWENIIGRSGSSDIRIYRAGISRVHAVLTRNDKGVWKIFDVFSKGGVWVNSMKISASGIVLHNGDVINLGGCCVRFLDISKAQKAALEEKRSTAGKNISPAVTLTELSFFQLFLLMQLSFALPRTYLSSVVLGFAAIIILQWTCYNAMRAISRSGFEVEILAFYLTSLGMAVAASSTPEDIYKQILLTVFSVILFLFTGWWLRDVKRSSAMRVPVGAIALILLAVNVIFSEAVFGAKNWLEFGGYSFQPSELIKFAYIYVGAATMDKLYHRKNLYSFIIFSAVCVIALALIGDFGTALIFFVSFLIISFMRSGSIATVFLAISGAGLAGFLAVMSKPYIAQRFSSWGHVWEDVYNAGYQQTRAMSAAASGGLFGKGTGAGWLKGIFAANTDMVFAVICEELGLIIAICMVSAILILAFFAVRSARQGRSAYNAIAACAAMSMLLTQMALNIFGSLDILPFTGVTFPFVSRGGSSLISCWQLMAFIKSADNRRNASFAVRSGGKARGMSGEDEDLYAEDYLYDPEEAENDEYDITSDYTRNDGDESFGDDENYFPENYEDFDDDDDEEAWF